MSIFLEYLDQICFYRLYYDNPPQVQSHTQLMHGKLSTTQIYGTVDRHTSARNKILSPLELLHGNDLQWKLNGEDEFYNNIDEGVVF